MKPELAPVALENAYSFIKDWSADLAKQHGVQSLVILFHPGADDAKHAHLRTVGANPGTSLWLLEAARVSLEEAARKACGCETCQKAQTTKEGRPYESTHH